MPTPPPTPAPTPEPAPSPAPTIFVFGSNLAGRHGAGAARYARQHWGAEYGVGAGPTGNAYAIPTKDEKLRPLPLAQIAVHIGRFLAYARTHPDREFLITALGTGFAGYRHEQIGPLFASAPPNCRLPSLWVRYRRHHNAGAARHPDPPF